MEGKQEIHMSIESELLSVHIDSEVMASIPLLTSEYLFSYADQRIYVFPLDTLIRGDDIESHCLEINDHVTSFAFDHSHRLLILSTPSNLRTIQMITDDCGTTLDHKLLFNWRHGHKGYICRIACGRGFIATGGADGALRLWTSESTECIHSRPPTASCITLLRACNPPGCDTSDLLVCADRQLTILLVDSAGKGRSSVREIFTDTNLNAHSSQIIDMLDVGSSLITLGLDKILCVWTMQPDANGLHVQLASRILTGNADVCGLLRYGTNEFYSLDRQRRVRQCRLEDGVLSINNQQKRLVCPHTQECTVIHSQHQPSFICLYSRDDGILDVYEKENELVHRRSILMDTTKLNCIYNGSVSDSTMILQSGISLVSMAGTCRVCQRVSLPGKLVHASASEDATYLAICCSESPEVSQIRILLRKNEDYTTLPEQFLQIEDDVSCMDLFSHKTNVYLAVGTRNGSFIIKQEGVQTIRRSPPGKMYDTISLIRWVSANAVVICSFEGKVKDSPPVLFNTKKDEFIKLHVHKPILRAVDVQLDHRDMIAVAYTDGSTHLYNRSTGQCIQTIESPTSK